MKKIILLLMVILLCFSGCTKKDKDYGLDAKNPISLTVWHYYNGPLKTSFDEQVNEFNATVGADMGIVVEAYSQGSVNELAQKVLDAAEKKVGAESLPNVFAGYQDTVYVVDQMGFIADIQSYFTKSELSDYVEGYLQEGDLSGNQELKIFPIAKTTEIMMINKTDWDAFVASNSDINESMLTTWESLAIVAQRYYEWTDSLTPIANDGKAFFGRDAYANYLLVGSSQLDHPIFEKTNNQISYNADEATLRKLWDNFYIPFIKGYYGAYGRFRSDDCKTGDLIALVGSSSGALYFPTEVTKNDDSSYPIESMVLPIPNFEATEAYAVQQGAGMAVVKGDANYEYASSVFLKWITDKERNISFSLSSGYLPVTKEANSMDVIQESIKDNTDISEKLIQSLPVGIQTVTSSHLFTALPFDGSAEARNILEKVLIDRAKADREVVVSKLQSGLSLDESTAEFTTDAYFQAWMEDMSNQINAVIK